MTAARADDFIDHPPPETTNTKDSPTPTPQTPASVTDVTDLIAARRIIDEAKRLLMERGNLTEPEAHRWIQKTAMDRRAPKLAIAAGIIEALSEKT
jgi:ANTAR domain